MQKQIVPNQQPNVQSLQIIIQPDVKGGVFTFPDFMIDCFSDPTNPQSQNSIFIQSLSTTSLIQVEDQPQKQSISQPQNYSSDPPSSIKIQINSTTSKKNEKRKGKSIQTFIQRFITFMIGQSWQKNLGQTIETMKKYGKKQIKKKNKDVHIQDIDSYQALRNIVKQIYAYEEILKPKLNMSNEAKKMIKLKFTDPTQQQFIQDLFEKIRIKFFQIMFNVQIRKFAKKSDESNKNSQNSIESQQKNSCKFLDQKGQEQLKLGFEQQFDGLKYQYNNQKRHIENYEAFKQEILTFIKNKIPKKKKKRQSQQVEQIGHSFEQQTAQINSDDDSDDQGCRLTDNKPTKSETPETTQDHNYQDKESIDENNEIYQDQIDDSDEQSIEEDQTQEQKQQFDSLTIWLEKKLRKIQEVQNKKNETHDPKQKTEPFDTLVYNLLQKAKLILIQEEKLNQKEKNSEPAKIAQNSQLQQLVEKSNPEKEESNVQKVKQQDTEDQNKNSNQDNLKSNFV